MLKIKNLSFAFGKKSIFNDIGLSFEEGQITGIVGKNGVGKTTLFRIMTGIYNQQSGEINLREQRLKPSDISFMPTEPYFYPYMKGREYLEIVASTDVEKMKSRHYASFMDLPLDELVDNYSTGMRKKLAFSALFALDKPIIILDEPYNGVDLDGNEIIKHIIKSDKSEKIVILSSHILSTITDVSENIYHITEYSNIDHYRSDEFGLLQSALQTNMANKLSQLDIPNRK